MDQAHLIVTAVLGTALQWLKGLKNFPTWAAYGIFGGLAVLAYVYATPGAVALFQTNWREAVSSFLLFLVGIEGTSALARKVNAAPKTDSL